MAETLGDAARNTGRAKENPRHQRDHERLRQALQKATSTQHVTAPAPGRANENEQQSRLRRAAVPVGRKLNDHNNARAKKSAKTMTPQATKSTLLQSGVGIKTTEAFGVKPLQLI